MNKEEFKAKRILALGLTQIELGEKLGISNVYISQIENGHKEPSKMLLISFERLIKLETK